MKQILSFLLVFFLSLSVGFSQNAPADSKKTSSVAKVEFKVFGNCSMCKRTIEKSFKNEKGVESASWDKTSKVMKVSFDTTALSLMDIKQKIAAAGYDSEEVKATDEAYSKLPKCCKYRDPANAHEH